MSRSERLLELPDAALEILVRIMRESGYRYLVAVTEDIIDYFVDIARATDRIEMGGALLGKIKRSSLPRGALAVLFHDYVQVRNTADDPYRKYVPDMESVDEIEDLVKSCEYDVIAQMHTHPDAGIFSLTDLVSAKMWSEYFMKEYGRKSYPFRRSRLYIPDFIVSDGMDPALIAYTYETPFALAFVKKIPYLSVPYIVGSVPFSERDPENFEYLLDSVPWAVKKGYLEPDMADLARSCVVNCHCIMLPIKAIRYMLGIK